MAILCMPYILCYITQEQIIDRLQYGTSPALAASVADPPKYEYLPLAELPALQTTNSS